MNIFIDTAVKGCNVALFDQDNILASVQEPIERGHAEAILPLYEGLMKGIEKTAQDIENVYVTVGPGSFTGLRVGLTTAQFMGFSLGKSVEGVSTFQTFSCGVNDHRDRMVLVETKRADYYCQIMNGNHEPVGEAQCLPADQIINQIMGDMIVTGDAVERFQNETGFTGDVIAQKVTNVGAVISAIQSGRLSFVQPEAFYIRDADVSQPKATTR